MSELAYNIHGESFDVPAEAVAWRVRRMKSKGKGAPEVVYDGDGVPLLLSIDAGIEDLRAEIAMPGRDEGAIYGRYRLDPVGEDERPLPDATSAYLYLRPQKEIRNADSGGAAFPAPSIDLQSVFAGLLKANIELGAANANLTRTVVEGFSGIMESTSSMMRAAGSLPMGSAPTPPALQAAPAVAMQEDEEEEEEDQEPKPTAPGLDLQAMMTTLLTTLLTGVCSGQIKLPSLAAVLGGRPAPEPAPRIRTVPPVEEAGSTPAPPASSAGPAREPDARARPAAAAPPPVDLAALMGSLPPMALGRLMAVQQALSPQERVLVLELLRELSTGQLVSWAEELASVSEEEALGKVRDVLRSGTAGSKAVAA